MTTEVTVEDRREWLKRREAAAHLRKPVSTLADWASKGYGPPYYKAGRDALYDRAELDAWVAEQAVEPQGVA